MKGEERKCEEEGMEVIKERGTDVGKEERRKDETKGKREMWVKERKDEKRKDMVKFRRKGERIVRKKRRKEDVLQEKERRKRWKKGTIEREKGRDGSWLGKLEC